METVQSLLSDPLTLQLLSTHPNTYAVDSTLPRLPYVSDSLDLVKFYATGELNEGTYLSSRIPDELIQLISSIRQLQLSRSPIQMPDVLPLRSEQGMSPKKAHEVSRMATYIVNLASRLPSSSKVLRIVDIGAGQGYLTRALKLHLPNSHILALDADIEQTKGAQKWEKKLLPKEAQEPPIEHKVAFISPDSLLDAVDEWVEDDSQTRQEELEGKKELVPILFVALHACGSLTPDILRAFSKATLQPGQRSWYPAGVVVVGCCYNLMNPSDYPPSTRHLPLSAYHLAAQIPSQWLLPSNASTDPPNLKLDPTVALSIRKVTWRALLSKALEDASPRPIAPSSTPPNPNGLEANNSSAPVSSQTNSATVPARWSRRPASATEQQYGTPESGTGSTPTMNRLGRLRDSVYTSWNNFLRVAGDKLGVVFDECEFDAEEGEGNGDKEEEEQKGRGRGRDEKLENELAVLHVLRCLLGPAIESAILMDRVGWVRKELGISFDHVTGREIEGKEEDERGTDKTTPGLGFDAFSSQRHRFKVEFVNLFDQSTGSGRNVAIVVEPQAIGPQ